MRTFRLAVSCFVLLIAFAIVGEAPADAMSPAVAGDQLTALQCRPRDTCCKVCSKGKACGNSCISRSKRCHRGQGCACNRSDVCA